MFPLLLCSVLLQAARSQVTTTSSQGLGTYILAGLSNSTTTGRSLANSTQTASSTTLASTDSITTFPVTAEGAYVVYATGLANDEILAPGTTVYPDQVFTINSSTASASLATSSNLPSTTSNLTASHNSNHTISTTSHQRLLPVQSIMAGSFFVLRFQHRAVFNAGNDLHDIRCEFWPLLQSFPQSSYDNSLR